MKDKFLDACHWAHDGELQPALHGTNESNLTSIYSRGLLIPGSDSGVKVANGSVHGVGIYTAYVESASLSWSYARGERRPILVCGVLDPRKNAKSYCAKDEVTYTCSARIFFSEKRVAPLFEASRGSLAAEQRPPLAPPPLKPKTIRPEWVVVKKPKGPGPRTRLRRAATNLRSALRFLTRRAVRKRQA